MLRTALSYALFVGIPVAALLGVLRAGERLVAPMAVHGRYGLALEWMAGAEDACLAGLLRGARALELAQSGRRVELRIPEAPGLVLYGTLDGTALEAAGRITRSAERHAPACRRGDGVRLTAAVRREGGVARLEGRAERRDCLACVPVGLVAERPAAPRPDA